MLEVLFPSLDALEQPLFAGCAQAPWEAIVGLAESIGAWLTARDAAARITIAEGAQLDGIVSCAALYLGAGAVVDPTVVIVGGPVVIAPGAAVRAGAYIRGPAYIGSGAIVGHATEVKNSILLHEARAPHFNFVGDSILGADCNLGAGTRLANLRLDGRSVRLDWQGARLETGMRKLGALVGQQAQTGCNSVCNPGTILLPGTLIAPCTAVTGTIGPRGHGASAPG